MLEVKEKDDNFVEMSHGISKQHQLFNKNKQTGNNCRMEDEEEEIKNEIFVRDSFDNHVLVNINNQQTGQQKETSQQQKPLACRLKNIINALIAGKKGEQIMFFMFLFLNFLFLFFTISS